MATLLKKTWPVFLVSLPSAGLTIAYFLRSPDVPSWHHRFPFFKLIASFVTLGQAMVCFENKEAVFSFIVSFAVLLLAAQTLKQFLFERTKALWEGFGFFIAALCITGLYFVFPDAFAGGSFLSPRLSLFIYFALLFWIGYLDLSPFHKKCIVYVAIVASLGLTSFRISKYVAFNKDLTEYLSCEFELRPNTTMLPLFYINERSGIEGTAYSQRTRPLDTAAGYIMASRAIIDLAHYESGHHYFPTRFRDELDPYKFIGRGPDWQQRMPPKVDLLSYSNNTNGQIDYLLIWGLDVAEKEIRRHRATITVISQLTSHYKLVFVSKPRGLLKLYERKPYQNKGDPERHQNHQLR